MEKKRKIAVILGSRSDLKQCKDGLLVLQQEVQKGTVEVFGVYIRSIHRNTEATLSLLKELSVPALDVDVIIAGAGMANHLTGCTDAYLRYEIGNMQTVVVGVAFENQERPEWTDAAGASIIHVPGTQVVFNNYVGADGFRRACEFAVTGTLPEIKEPEPRPSERFTLEKALAQSAA